MNRIFFMKRSSLHNFVNFETVSSVSRGKHRSSNVSYITVSKHLKIV